MADAEAIAFIERMRALGAVRVVLVGKTLVEFSPAPSRVVSEEPRRPRTPEEQLKADEELMYGHAE